MPGSKITLRTHLERMSLIDPTVSASLETPPLPYVVTHIWAWWIDISRFGRNGAGSIRWEAIEAYDRLKHLDMMAEELHLLLAIEDERLKHAEEKRARQAETTGA